MTMFSFKKVGGLTFIKVFDFQITFCRSKKSAKQRLDSKRHAMRLAEYRKMQRLELRRLREMEWQIERQAAKERLEFEALDQWFDKAIEAAK